MTNPDIAFTVPQMRFGYASLEEAWPEVDPECDPFGDRVLVQVRLPKEMTAGGIYVPEESRDTEIWNTQVAKVISLGPLAFCDRETGEPWQEGEWCRPGDFVRIPKMGGDRFWMPVGTNHQVVLFIIFKDHGLIGKITGDPLKVAAYL